MGNGKDGGEDADGGRNAPDVVIKSNGGLPNTVVAVVVAQEFVGKSGKIVAVENGVGVLAGNGDVVDVESELVDEFLFGEFSSPGGIGRLAFDLTFDVGVISDPKMAEFGFETAGEGGGFFVGGKAFSFFE